METIFTTEAPPRPTATYVDVERPKWRLSLVTALRKMALDSGTSGINLVRKYVRLGFGPGRLSFAEYAMLRLFDRRLHAKPDTKAFVGLRAARKIWHQANYRPEPCGVIGNKIATAVLFSAYGFPTIPTLAVFRNQVGLPSPHLLRNDGELRAFLTDASHYPLFGKPLSGELSLGSASFERYDRARDCLVDVAGKEIPVDRFIAEIVTHYAAGYLFQKRVVPHALVREICGERLATLRILTIIVDGKPEIVRACWKIPAGANAADNFWRAGNLLAQLDGTSGRVIRVMRRTPNGIEEVTHHPDTGVSLVGTSVPCWTEAARLALEGAKVVGDVPLIGWDIAPTERGAVIVELNHTPDFMLHQLADGRGILDAQFKRFLAQRRRHAASWRRDQVRRLLASILAENVQL